MRRTRWLIVLPLGAILLVAGPGKTAFQNSSKVPWEDLPSDQRRTHQEIIVSGRHSYSIHMGGQIDGTMTRMPISYKPYRQGWQANRWVRLENIGETDVLNPWLTVDGRGDWRTIGKVVEEATHGCNTDAEKARALWEWTRHHRFHASTWDAEVYDAVKVYNIYGYTLCDGEAIVQDDLWKTAGLMTRIGRPEGHAVSEVFYEGDFHLLDSDMHVICLERDNRTISSEAEVVRDHDLMKRTHTYGIGAAESRRTREFSASLYGYGGKREDRRGMVASHTMFFTMRPGEGLEWRFSHVGKEYSKGTTMAGEKWTRDGEGQLRAWGNEALDNLRNGKWFYQPPLSRAVWERGALVADNWVYGAASGLPPGIHPRVPGEPARAVWKLQSPYVIVGATIKCQFLKSNGADRFRLSFSPDGQSWTPLIDGGREGQFYEAIQVDKYLSPRGKPMYKYFIQVEMQASAPGSVGLYQIIFDTDVQMSLLGMPELQVGENQILYTDETPGPRQVKVTHTWVERTAWQPPEAPAKAVFPADGATVEGTRFTFKWSPSSVRSTPLSGRQGARITEYHIQVCDREDMRWVISPNFDRLISLTPAKSAPEWTVPSVGLLNPDTTYYWRVRAKDNNGVWGPWSRRFNFRCAAPGVPLNLQAIPDNALGTVDLDWEENPEGRPPVAYKVYGSDEQGFTASDTEYTVFMGNGFCNSMEQYNAAKRGDPFVGDVKTPANLVTRTDQTVMTVVGPGLSIPNANKAFYRVVAVDAQGNESGPSNYVAMPRPWVYTAPVTAAKVGEVFHYAPQAIASIGHLTCQRGYNTAFWKRDKLTWKLAAGPAWLKLQGAILAGTAGASDVGRADVVLKVCNQKGQCAEQRFAVTVAP